MRMIKQTVLILLTLLVVISCGGGSKGGGTTSTGITGTITDMSGTALEGVRVYVGNTETLTDVLGSYTLATGAGEQSLTAEKLNYTLNNKLVSVSSGAQSTQDLVLVNVDTYEQFDAAVGASLSAKGAGIALPSGAYVLEDGSSYSGTVTARASYNKVTNATGSAAFPGTFLGEELNGETTVLQSYGFIDVTLHSADGAALNLADSATATLTFPMDDKIADTPASIPLWYFDVTKGIWVEEGSAAYDAGSNSYSGTVSHFSTWNLDKKMNGATLQGCIEDGSGAIVPIADLYISAPGWSKTVTNNDASGTFEFINAPSGIELSLIAKVGDQSSTEQKVTLVADNTTIMESCLVVDVDSSELFATLTGSVVDDNDAAIADQSIRLFSVAEGMASYQSQARTDAEGAFSFTFKRAAIENVELRIGKTFGSQYLDFNNAYSIDPVKDETDVGTIKLATTSVDACVTLESGSSTTEGVTTLSDGVTTVDDGTVVLGSGFTSFGSDERQLRVGAPYEQDFNVSTFDSSGTFSFIVPQDNLPHRFYAHVYDSSEAQYVLTGSMELIASQSAIDMSDAEQCIQLHAMKTAEAVTASASVASQVSVHLEISSPSDYNFVSGDPKVSAKTFTVDENGLYVIQQVTDNFNETVSGSISVTLGGKTQTTTIPSSASSEFWTGFAIESYDGDVSVKLINEPYWGMEF